MTYAVQGALQKAVEISKEYELQNIENEALLKATLEESESLFKSVLERANIDVDQLTKAYEDKLKNYPSVQGDNVQYGQYISPKANELLNKAETYMKTNSFLWNIYYALLWTLIKQRNNLLVIKPKLSKKLSLK